jgi:hypothetical protein
MARIEKTLSDAIKMGTLGGALTKSGKYASSNGGDSYQIYRLKSKFEAM